MRRNAVQEAKGVNESAVKPGLSTTFSTATLRKAAGKRVK
jgi:hypothetical protein